MNLSIEYFLTCSMVNTHEHQIFPFARQTRESSCLESNSVQFCQFLCA